MFQILTHSLTLSFIHFLPFFFPPFTNSVLPSFPSFLDPFPLKSWSFWYALLLVFVLVFNNIESRNILINWLENILLKISSKQATIATVAKQEDSNSQTCFLFCFVLFFWQRCVRLEAVVVQSLLIPVSWSHWFALLKLMPGWGFHPKLKMLMWKKPEGTFWAGKKLLTTHL